MHFILPKKLLSFSRYSHFYTFLFSIFSLLAISENVGQCFFRVYQNWLPFDNVANFHSYFSIPLDSQKIEYTKNFGPIS